MALDQQQRNQPRRPRVLALGRLGLVLIASTVVLAACGSGSSATGSSASSPPPQVAPQAVESGPNPYAYLPKVPSFQLNSTTVVNGKPLPTAQLSKLFKVPGGQDESPELSWSGFPAATKSFVVSMYDPEAPTGSGFTHWVVADIPASTTSLPAGAGAPNSTLLPAGAFQLGGDAGAHQYVGGAPPAGSGIHDYYITVTALNVAASGADANTSAAYLGFGMGPHTIARATIICPTAAASN